MLFEQQNVAGECLLPFSIRVHSGELVIAQKQL
jgi:hypothetical protein